jgi:hypothetical protein
MNVDPMLVPLREDARFLAVRKLVFGH